ncbi:MAG TPA: nucleotide sugar dehydrogenase [Candidatus Bilamarchaeaceae archaeon]|nr:nucleotide sugar dehydrogenase [Candidatus Bilamarchaeaceae archaeon]
MKIVIVGLGYVGLPLAVKFARHFPVIGYDINAGRVSELQNGIDRNNDVSKGEFAKTKKNIEFTNNEKRIADSDVIIISVPTPLDAKDDPDLSYLESASRAVARQMKKGALIIYESSVYPGCTQEFCLPVLERESKMKLGEFYLGYSPERVNPGDKAHSVDKITKLIAASHPQALKKMQEVYSKITKTHVMSSIRAAEAAKIIENVQRDINLALFNELSMLFDKLGLDSEEIFNAAATKWNFIKFKPGLVGGYCIPVNPHYLAYKAKEIGFNPELILAGRKKNEEMPKFIARKASQLVSKNAKVLILGATYKENVAELRSSRVKNLVDALKQEGFQDISIYDPLVKDTGIFGLKSVKPNGKSDLIIYAVAHNIFSNLPIAQMLNARGSVIDIPRKLDQEFLEKSGFTYWAP